MQHCELKIFFLSLFVLGLSVVFLEQVPWSDYDLAQSDTTTMAGKLWGSFLVLLTGVQSKKVSNRTPPGFGQNDPFNERLQSVGLLGSHFGMIDVPATYAQSPRRPSLEAS
jgi:hypothetical protein